MTLDEARKLAAKHIDREHRRGNWGGISMSDVITDAAGAILDALAEPCMACGGAKGRLLGHLTDSNPPPMWVDCYHCRGTGKNYARQG